jgi:DNA replication factor Dna2
MEGRNVNGEERLQGQNEIEASTLSEIPPFPRHRRPPPEPSMTQDCVVEWNESKHTSVDLRKLADPTFQSRTSIGGGLDTPFRSSTSSNRRRRSSVASSNDERSASPVPQRRRVRRRRGVGGAMEPPFVERTHPTYQGHDNLELRNPRPPLATLSTTSTLTTTNNPIIPTLQQHPEKKNHHFDDLLRIIQQSDHKVHPNIDGELENPSPSNLLNETACKAAPDVSVELSSTSSIRNTNATTSANTTTAEKEDDDEFVDIHFTTEDLAAIDSLVVRVHQKECSPDNLRTTTRNMPQSLKDQPTLKETEDPLCDDEFPDVDIDDLLRATGHRENNTQQRHEPRSPEDPFSDLPDVALLDSLLLQEPSVLPNPTEAAQKEDEFPDFDFEALDHLILARGKTDDIPPPEHAAIRNPRHRSASTDPKSYLTFSRYKILTLREDTSTFTKTATLARWTLEMLNDEENVTRAMHHPTDLKRPTHDDPAPRQWTRAGVIHLRGEWYHTPLQEGDVVHVVSLTGTFQTDELPLTLHTCPPTGSDKEDDLVLVVHPDLLLTPTIISETVTCTRRAILKSRLGTTGLTCKLINLL